MSELNIIPTPAELLYQIQNSNDDDGHIVIKISCVFFVAALIAVVLRFVARRIQHIGWHIDDFVILVALVSGSVYDTWNGLLTRV